MHDGSEKRLRVHGDVDCGILPGQGGPSTMPVLLINLTQSAKEMVGHSQRFGTWTALGSEVLEQFVQIGRPGPRESRDRKSVV